MKKAAELVEQSDLMTAIRRARERAPSDAEVAKKVRQWKEIELAQTGIPRQVLRFVARGKDERGHPARETDSWRRLERALEDGRRIIVLSGLPGTGKTFAAGKWMALHPEHARWVSAVDYCNLAPWSDRVLAYRGCTRLVIDDLGLEAARQQERIEQLLYDRHAGTGITVATTNLAADDFKRTYNDRIFSRLKEVGLWVPCNVQERDRGKQTEMEL